MSQRPSSSTRIGNPKEQTVIFELYSQDGSSTTRRFGRTGLGLAISRRAVEHVGGSLELARTPGAGSAFFLDAHFPVRELPAGNASASSKPPEGVRAPVDDNDINRSGIH